MIRKLMPCLGFLAAGLVVGCGDDQGRDHYSATLRPLNDSGVRGNVTMEQADDDLTVRMRASGLAPRQIVGRSIRGFRAGEQEAECPGQDNDDNADRMIDNREAAPAYGRQLLVLQPFPTTSPEGEVNDLVEFKVTQGLVEALPGSVVVLEGVRTRPRGEPRARFIPNLPAACGRITRE